jgi:hypothetical protein
VSSPSTIRVFVDRLEAGTAVFEELDEGVTFEFPATFLPEDAGEGSVLEVTLEDRPDLAEKRSKEVEDLQDRLIEKPDDE